MIFRQKLCLDDDDLMAKSWLRNIWLSVLSLFFSSMYSQFFLFTGEHTVQDPITCTTTVFTAGCQTESCPGVIQVKCCGQGLNGVCVCVCVWTSGVSMIPSGSGARLTPRSVGLACRSVRLLRLPHGWLAWKNSLYLPFCLSMLSFPIFFSPHLHYLTFSPTLWCLMFVCGLWCFQSELPSNRD